MSNCWPHGVLLHHDIEDESCTMPMLAPSHISITSLGGSLERNITHGPNSDEPTNVAMRTQDERIGSARRHHRGPPTWHSGRKWPLENATNRIQKPRLSISCATDLSWVLNFPRRALSIGPSFLPHQESQPLHRPISIQTVWTAQTPLTRHASAPTQKGPKVGTRTALIPRYRRVEASVEAQNRP